MDNTIIGVKSLQTKNGTVNTKSRRNVVGIATGYVQDDRGVRDQSPGGVKNFLLTISSMQALERTKIPIQWAQRALSSGVKREESETDHSPPTSVEVNKIWIYTYTPHTPSWPSA
jgi:hypothetical protein